ncbi:MAG: hypothetical protein AAB011_05705 [Candidatus Eisenbacteria bacterium]
MEAHAETRAASGSDPEPGGAAAILVIHGIGEQRPYQTLDAFVQGLAREFGISAGQLSHRLVPWSEGTLTTIRMPLPKPVGSAKVRTLDFYEFHWAGMVVGGISLPQVLAWLVRTALTPLQLWSQQATVLIGIKSADRSSREDLWKLFLSEIGRSLLLLAAAVLLVAPFLYAASQPEALSNAWSKVSTELSSVRSVAILAGFLLLALMVIAALRGAVGLLRDLRVGGASEKESVRWWAKASAWTAIVLLVVGYALDLALRLDTLRLVGAIADALRPLPVLAPLLATGAAVFLGKLLVSYLGDVALYTTADENSAYFRTRVEILGKATGLLRHLCEHDGYAAVYLAGHSLGSVIAYDAVNRYVRDARAGTDQVEAEAGLFRLKGLLTFGSPLDAVYYLFRTAVGAEEPVRAQLLSSLHGFRKRSSGRSYGPLALAPYDVPKLSGCNWLNVYSPMDPVSRRLVFYAVDRQERRFYPWSPIRAHLAYWKDPGFYRMVREWL